MTVEFHDPTLNPARARLMGVQFAGTAVMESEDRRIQVHGSSETDIANGILRVSQGAKQRVCFLEGHGEADPFSMESHDHLESTAGHSHGLGAQYVLHERHGLAKARHSLEALNYSVEKRSLAQQNLDLSTCALLIVAGPKTALLPTEVDAIRTYLASGGNGFFMLEPFVSTGLEPVIHNYGVVLDKTIVIDRASHYWADVSAPAVTTYSRHQITRDLPLTFYPGARSLSPTPQRVPGVAVTPIVSASKNSYGETTQDRAEYDQGEDLPGPNTLMVVVNRRLVESASARSRLAVVGDADFATNSFFHFLGNGNLFLNTVNYLVAQENLIGIEPRTHDLPRLSMTNRQMKGTLVLSVLLMPALLALVGGGSVVETAMKQPPVRRRLFVVWLLLAILLTGIIVHEATDIFEPTPPPRTGRLPMFSFGEPELGRVEVMHQGQVTALMRDAAGAWFHHDASRGHHHKHDGGHRDHHHADSSAPHAADATASTAIAEGVNLMTRMLADRRVQPAQNLDHYGLTKPQTMLAFYGRQAGDDAQPLAVLHIGDLLTTQYAYYTMRPGDRELSLIPRYYIALFLALVFGENQAPTPLPVREDKGGHSRPTPLKRPHP